MSFESFNFSTRILHVLKKNNYVEPTPIQREVIPLILQRKDIIAVAQTGTGKTAAYMLPSLEYLYRNRLLLVPNKPRILVLTPTRELAEQITQQTIKYSGESIKI